MMSVEVKAGVIGGAEVTDRGVRCIKHQTRVGHELNMDRTRIILAISFGALVDVPDDCRL